MTFNLLVNLPNDSGLPNWSVRRFGIKDAISRAKPDLIGWQEPLASQVRWLAQELPQYASIPLESLQTDAAVFYDPEKFEVLDWSWFTLSTTPERPMSRGWGNLLPRIQVHVKFRIKATGQLFYFLNTHFDNTSPFQVHAANYVIPVVEKLAAELPVVYTGDFNSKPESEAYKILAEGIDGGGFHLNNVFDVAKEKEVWQDESGDIDYDFDSRIDHIWTAGGEFGCDKWVVDVHKHEGAYPSDHFAIFADMVFPRAEEPDATDEDF
ncbi:MAG: hypothetical protein NUW37_16435 [Planctomycetes bacterium]|nr:hypothetical protein [Planctomycetota bacterium]